MGARIATAVSAWNAGGGQGGGGQGGGGQGGGSRAGRC